MTFSEIYNQGFKELGLKILSWVQCGKLVNLSESQISILNSIYYTMKPRIEDLPEKEKHELWETAKKESKHQSKKERLKYAKAIYTLNQLEKEEKTGAIREPGETIIKDGNGF